MEMSPTATDYEHGYRHRTGGVEADEAIHCIVDTMFAKRPYTTITHAVHIRPTVSELMPTTLEDLRPLENA
jgi:hypothetical protein